MNENIRKEYQIYLKKARTIIESDQDNHPTALIFLLIYYAGMVKYLARNRKLGKLLIKLDKIYFYGWLFSFDLNLHNKFLYFILEKFYNSIMVYRPLLLKRIQHQEIEQQIFMLDLLFDPEEIVFGLDIFRYITIHAGYLVDLSIYYQDFKLSILN